MENPTNNRYPIYPLIRSRWSPRAFSEKPVEKEKLQSLFEAARWAPSSMNEQPWRFIVGEKGDETWEKIHDALVEFNQNWATRAPVLIVNLGKKTFTYKGRENVTYQYDTGQAVAFMVIEAVNQGLVAHQMGGFHAEKIIEVLNIPEDFKPISVTAIGYQGDPEKLPADLYKSEFRERERRSLHEQVFSDKFGLNSKLF
ncbi:MAG TPA: nitroreductase family protein [Bacteroidales bacterium]